MDRNGWTACAMTVLCIWVSGCVALTKAVHFPERRPSGPEIQAIANRLTGAAGAAPVAVTVWGNLEYPSRIRFPIAVISGEDEILVHASAIAFFKDNPDALATMFGHELGHLLVGYPGNPEGESKADAYGVILAARAGFDPWVGAVWQCAYFKANDSETMRGEKHPPAGDRCRTLVTAAGLTGIPLRRERLPKTR